MKEEVEFRKAQELTFRMIQAGLHNEIAKWHRALFDAYKKQNFSDEQAIRLVMANIRNDKA